MLRRAIALALLCAASASAATFVCDPAKGVIDNPGTADQPWPAIEAVIAKGLLPTGAKTPNASVKPGDTVLLRTGFHGRIYLAGGNNVEGNIIDRFSGDAIRATRDGIVVRHNIIMNNFVSEKDGDKNHDDGIQCFLFNKGRGLVRNITIEGNIILERSEPNLPLRNPLQGIGFFDGPLENFAVKDNVVRVNAYHGVAIYDGQGCTVTNNVCLAQDAGSKSKPWVMLGQKRQLAKGNTVTGNRAHSFNFTADAAVTAADNEQIDPAFFQNRQAEALAVINKKFGKIHPVSKKPRLNP